MTSERLKPFMYEVPVPVIGHARSRGCSLGLTAALLLWPVHTWATDVTPVSAEQVAELMTRDLIGAPGKEVLMITVKYLAGAASLPHRHDAQVFVYVLEGEVTMQVQGQAPVTLRPGQTFYEGPNDIHEVSANASQTAPAKILVFMVKDKGKLASRDVRP
jgi:quercetin dioxygenase-like cupin family protein